MSQPDFAKGASGPDPYASGLGIQAPYLGGASATANATAGSGTTGTSLPSSPSDNQLYTYVVDGTNGVLWTLRYYLAGAYWAFVGGPPFFAEVLTTETTSSLTYVDLATAGPSLVIPRAGDYFIGWGNESFNGAASNGNLTTVTGGGISASDNYSAITQGVIPASVGRGKVFTGVTAGATVKLQYRVGGNTGSFAQRFIYAVPLKVT